MREVVFKNLTSAGSRKKDILLKEIFERDGVIARTERRCFYFIKEISEFTDKADFQKLIDAQNNTDNPNKRQFHILKEHNDKLGEDKLICKIAGTFYVIVGQKIYTIAFLHSFKVIFVKHAFTN